MHCLCLPQAHFPETVLNALDAIFFPEENYIPIQIPQLKPLKQ